MEAETISPSPDVSVFKSCLTKAEAEQLNIFCGKLGLDLDQFSQQSKEGLSQIYQEMINKMPAKKTLTDHVHNYGISLLNFKSICSKIIYGHSSYIRSDPFVEFRPKKE